MAVRDLWEKTKFPSTLKFAEDLDVALEKVGRRRCLMYRYEEFHDNSNESLAREIRDLEAMIPLGTDLRLWLFEMGL